MGFAHRYLWRYCGRGALRKRVERPILFKGRLVRAILEGRKTQTRRIVKLDDETLAFFGGADHLQWRSGPGHSGVGWYCASDEYPDEGSDFYRCPFGRRGDRLWVKETFCPVDDREHGGEQWIDYRATPKYSEEHPAGWDNAPDDPEALKWKPSIYMPRAASRIDLEVTNVRVERLQAITELDALAEGAIGATVQSSLDGVKGQYVVGSARDEFSNLWDTINAKRAPWKENPWVWVIDFKRIRP